MLVAYGSNNGSTAEIAERVGEVLAKEGLAVDVLSTADATDLAPYGAVVVPQRGQQPLAPAGTRSCASTRSSPCC
ncbi:hypothetical protein G3M58_03130 [Streptomyces sp. SID7499]|uniref:Flavodoxin-like domain-containing protein n=1 Tax=Streptomyces sp. SID7499 TaxID=2706086 RepID=A0A6G3WIY6_9ACTN|nr:hypothetical protein [Streptomyces sp. SID7499]